MPTYLMLTTLTEGRTRPNFVNVVEARRPDDRDGLDCPWRARGAKLESLPLIPVDAFPSSLD